MNKLYLLDEMYNNFFVAGRKIIRNTYDKTSGKRRKIYDKARTPYARLLEFYGKENNYNNEICKPLQEVYDTLDPWELVTEIDRTLRQLGKLKK